MSSSIASEDFQFYLCVKDWDEGVMIHGYYTVVNSIEEEAAFLDLQVPFIG